MGLKVALYLQTKACLKESRKETEEYTEEYIKSIKNDYDYDIFVFPEISYHTYSDSWKKMDIFNDKDLIKIYNDALKYSKQLGKAVVITGQDCNKSFFSVWANAFANGKETKTALYRKHTSTGKSPFEFSNYSEDISKWFPIIQYKDHKIGLIICYDSTISVLSRCYGLNSVDLIINSTGGNVKENKWKVPNCSRAIENKCSVLVTMGNEDKRDSFVFGFDKNGNEIQPEYIDQPNKKSNYGVYIFPTIGTEPYKIESKSNGVTKPSLSLSKQELEQLCKGPEKSENNKRIKRKI